MNMSFLMQVYMDEAEDGTEIRQRRGFWISMMMMTCTPILDLTLLDDRWVERRLKCFKISTRLDWKNAGGYILRSAFGSGNPGIVSAPLARNGLFNPQFLYFQKTDFFLFKVSVYTLKPLLLCL